MSEPPAEPAARVAGFATEDEAREAAARVLEGGVGPMLLFSSEHSSVAQWWVTVLPHDYRRACKILGVEPVELEPVVGGGDAIVDDEPVKVRRWPPDREHLTRFILLYVLLLVVATVGAFFAAYWLTGGPGEVERPPPVNPTVSSFD